MYKIIRVFLFVNNLVFVALQSCNYIVNIGVNYRESKNPNSTWVFTRLTSCISDESFIDRAVVHLWFAEGNLPILEKYFISNMKNLKELYIENCHVETIEPGAFSNLPQLEKININTNPIKTLLSGVFNILPSLQIIQIYKNKLSFIEDHAFANLSNLKDVSLNDNNLEDLNRTWFTNTDNIEIFNLFRNGIRKIPFGMFHGWKRLIYVYLNSNAISVIEGEIFKDNPTLISALGLHHNRLVSIAPDTFSDSYYMGYLSLSGNLLNYLSEEFLNKVRVGNIAIYGNPFKCPCLEKINKILLEKRVTIDHPVYTFAGSCKDGSVPVCGLSSSQTRTCIESVDKELTRRVLAYMKKVRYDTVYDPSGQQCAMFDELD